MAVTMLSAEAGEPITVTLDYAKLLKLPPGTSTLVIGNPAIADVAIQRNQLMVVTGRSYGRTNLIALDAKGGIISESMVQVGLPEEGRLVVQRGANSHSYICNPTCAPSIVVGDDGKGFDLLKGQIQGREELARNERRKDEEDDKKE